VTIVTRARVFVAGTPRSGTTWIGQTLGRSTGTVYVHEPDSMNHAFALKAKAGRWQHIELETGASVPRYEALWHGAFEGATADRSVRGRIAKRLVDKSRLRERSSLLRGDGKTPRMRLATLLAKPPSATTHGNVVVKSVHACLAAEWISERFNPRVVVVTRHPLNVLASWHTLGHGGEATAAGHYAEIAARRWSVELDASEPDRFTRRCMTFAVLAAALAEAASRHPEWEMIRHERACEDPIPALKALSSRVGLEFGAEAEAYVRDSNQPGDRYATRRITSDLANKWQTTLSDAEVERAIEILARFPAELGLLEDVYCDGL
jgi:hypothetical protein